MTSHHDRSSDQDAAASALVTFQTDLKFIRRSAGNPSYELMGRKGAYSKSTIIRALNGTTLPNWDVVKWILMVCDVTTEDIARWRIRWAETMNMLNPLTSSVDSTDDRAVAENTEHNVGMECTTCGAWITNPARHEEWHNMFVPKLVSVPTRSARKGLLQRMSG